MTADFIAVPSRENGPIVAEPLSEMTRRLERGRARIGVSAVHSSV